MRRDDIAKVLLKNSEGKYLILRGSVWPERPDRSQKPDVPGGMVDPGETHVDGAVREMKEEAGITINPSDLRLAFAESFVFSDKAVNRLLYRIDVENVPEVTISWEHEGYWWKSADEVLALDIRDPYPAMFAHLKQIGELE
ncbi:TPA: hypothetical protein DIV49_00915 [Candidatus Saccharibacteria bacterium]|nr:hypothetical protein [Candidatus Saccharibacteria bacterium]HRJ91353.1 NUDIX hydrolase [Candidatus Saccharibacteria bacterium]